MLDLADRGFKAAIVSTVKDVKENMLIMKEHERNLSREIEIIKNRSKWKFQNLKIQYLNLKIHWMSLMQSWRERRVD